MSSGTTSDAGLGLSARTSGGVTVAELVGELDIASAPVLREELLNLLRPASSRLVIDLSKVSFCDASGLAVLVSTGRRARLLGGYLRLAAVSPQVARALQITGLQRKLGHFPTVEAATTSRHTAPPQVPADAGELREAVAALLTRADAWYDADPSRRFTPALRAMARARDGTDDTALETAARSLLAALVRHPLAYSSEVAATATRLRRVLTPAVQPSPV